LAIDDCRLKKQQQVAQRLGFQRLCRFSVSSGCCNSAGGQENRIEPNCEAEAARELL
jgi:hypothetical protein